MPRHLLSSSQPVRSSKALTAAVATVAIGVVLLVVSFAAGNYGTAEFENGTLTGGAKVVAVAGASGGKAVQFGAATPTPTPPSAPTPTPTPPPSGFPNASNTGYQSAPGYPGSLADCSNDTIQSNTTYKFCKFTNGVKVGTTGASGTPVNVTFLGCLIESGFNGVGPGSQALVQYDNGNNIVFSYDTFQPNDVSAPPVSYNQGVEYGVDQLENPPSYTAGSFSIDHSNFWGLAAAVQLGASSQSQPITISDSYDHDTRADGGIDHTDGILSNDGDGVTYLTINHNTIVSVANNEGIALQYAGDGYNHVTVTNNYVSGWHNTVDFGGTGTGNTNDTFTGNVFGSDIKPTSASLYIAYQGDDSWQTSIGNTWRNNTFHYVAAGGYPTPSDNGKFWLPQWTDQGWPVVSSTDWAK